MSELEYKQELMLQPGFGSNGDSDMSEIPWPRLSCNLWAVRLRLLTPSNLVGVLDPPILVLRGSINAHVYSR